MPIERIFLDWTRPALGSAAARLVSHYAAGGEARMDDATVVLPGGRAGRRLHERLLDEADRLGVPLIPPRVTTTGAVPELLYEAGRPLAEPALARRVWAEALRGLESRRLARVFPAPPPPDDIRGWTRLARQVERLHGDVAAGGLRFGDVVERCRDGLLYDDGERWRVLAAAQDAYGARLGALGYDDRELARIDALGRGAVAAAGDVWLVGVVDLPVIVRRMLEAAGGAGAMIRVLVHAPAERAADFDALGCVLPKRWLDARIPVADERLRVVGRPGDQAAAALDCIASFDTRYTADEITIGVPDEQVAPYIEQRLAAAGLPVHHATGVPMRRTGPYRLLAAVAAYLEGRRFAALAALLRHPDLERWLARAESAADVIGVADRYYAESLPGHVGGPLADTGGRRARLEAVIRALDADALLGGLRGRRRLAEWAPAILALLVEVYGAEPLDRRRPLDRRLLGACDRIRAAAAGFHRLPEAIDTPCDAVAAIRLLLDEVEAESIPPDAEHAAIELLGWLELHLDDAPALVVTGLNDPFVPESINADAFLPNALRARLGLTDNDRRYARDAYSLTAILHSRPEVRLIAGRRDAAGDPLRPSRLLFAAPERTIAERVRRFFDEEPARAVPAATEGGSADADAGDPAVAPMPRFRLPPEPELRSPEPIASLRVTDFRLLLQDPYRFALERVLRLETLDDDAREMDAALFGSLAHEVLRRFGAEEVAKEAGGREDAGASAVGTGSAVGAGPDGRTGRDGGTAPDGRTGVALAGRAATLARRLDAILDDEAGRRFGAAAVPAVRVQIEQLRARLHAFAEWHARWTAEGWRIAAVEVSPPGEGAPFEVDGEPILLRGRIDRIDHRPETGEWAVFDYKTSEGGADPEASHRKGRGEAKTWIDLQLPLYRHLLPHLRREDGSPLVPSAGPADVRLGYIRLPRDLDGVGEALAEWTGDDLAAADEAAREAVRLIRSNRFVFDPERIATFQGDPFAGLLGIGQLAGMAGGAGEVDDEAGGDA